LNDQICGHILCAIGSFLRDRFSCHLPSNGRCVRGGREEKEEWNIDGAHICLFLKLTKRASQDSRGGGVSCFHISRTGMTPRLHQCPHVLLHGLHAFTLRRRVKGYSPWRRTVGLLETSYDDTCETTSRSRARTLSKYSLDGDPLGLFPFSHHRSVKTQQAPSLVSWRTSASRDDPDPRVCPFCPAVVVPSQTLIFVFSK
jgi:hypothetical protein